MKLKIKRWSAAQKAEIILSLIKRTKNLVDACKENDLKQSEVEEWKENFLSSGERDLKAKIPNGEDREVKELREKVGKR